MIQKIIDKCNEISLIDGLLETLYMVFVSAIIAFILGLVLGLILTITDKNGIKPNKWINSILGLIVNLGRSIPFIILMVFLIPFTRLIVGQSWGETAAIIPLTIGAIPFVGRLTETHFKEVDKSIVESATCMGASTWRIAISVYLGETIPSLIRAFSLTTITLIGYSAMAGTIGAGGLGNIAIVWGYMRYDDLAMLISIILIILLVQIIQLGFELIAKKIDKSR